MPRKLRLVQYGCGKMSAYTMGFAYDKGAEFIAAFDVNPKIIGKDIGEIIGTEPKGVLVRPAEEAASVLHDEKPDLCIVTTMSLLRDIRSIFTLCATHGVNAISTCEEAFYPWNSSYEMTKALDSIAKKNNCTLCGSGYQDLSWAGLLDTLAGSVHKMTEIRGSSSYNVEDYGIALAKAHGAGLSLEEFEREIAAANAVSDEQRQQMIKDGTFLPSYMWNSNGWLCAKLGLDVIRQTQRCVAQTHAQQLHSSTLDMTIPAGHATGMSAIVTTDTRQGIRIVSECIGKVYAADDYDKNEWHIVGQPDIDVVIAHPNTVEMTCATIVNRIPDVIAAPSGYVTTDRMPPLRYHTTSFEQCDCEPLHPRR